MNLFGNKKINAFGLDISDTSIKIVQLKPNRTEVELHAFVDFPLSEKVINNHLIVSEERLAQNVLKALAQAKRVDTKFVVCSIPETKSFVRTLEIPKIPENEIDDAIPFELEQDIPVPIDQVYIDWQVIHELPQSLKLLVTATPKDYVDSLVSTLRSIKLHPLSLELESQATARAVIGPADSGKSVLIADLSTMQTSFIIVRHGIIEYTSSIPLAGKAFTDSISRSSGISLEAAEKLKQTSGMLLGDNGAVRQAILPILDNIVGEIRNVIRFFEEHSPQSGPIDTVLLCGGSAKLSGILEYISQQLIPTADSTIKSVGLGNPWVNVPAITAKNPMSAQDALGFVTATGLALRGYQYHENN